MSGPRHRAARPFEFHRVSDGLVYRFEPVAGGGRQRWKRVDADLWCVSDGTGWWIVDAHGSRLGWPFSEGSHDSPPPGLWRSEKDGRSHVYRLEYVAN